VVHDIAVTWAKTKAAVPLSAGERYFEFTDSSKQLNRARKVLGLKENEALLCSPTEKRIRGGD
jgi:hypothetical protein